MEGGIEILAEWKLYSFWLVSIHASAIKYKGKLPRVRAKKCYEWKLTVK